MGFSSTVSAPPGGVWFWEDGDVLFESASYHEVVDKIRARFTEKGIAKDPAAALAEYMCPRMPPGFCRGFDGHRRKTTESIFADTIPYCGMAPETVDVIQRRLDVCSKCPMCDRSVCVTCRGIDGRIYELFGGRRMKLPSDRSSGVCRCAGAFAMAVASVVYDKNQPAWEGVPAECWRNNR